MISTNNWPADMNYITCQKYTGQNTPNRSLDLRSYFVNVLEPTTYGDFNLASDNTPFNGHSTMSFNMELLTISFNNGTIGHEQYVGNWTAGLRNPLILDTHQSMDKFKPVKIHRVYVVVVIFVEYIELNFYILLPISFIFVYYFINYHSFSFSKRHL